MKMNDVIFREYDIRGVYDKDLDAAFAFALGRAVASMVTRRFSSPFPTLTVGFDARLSSPQLADAVAEGMRQSGAHVIELGLITTPISYFSTFALPDVRGGVMVTGSHNPPEYNGFKISVGNTTIFGAAIKEISQIIKNRQFEENSGSRRTYDIFPQYVERYRQEFSGLNPVNVVLDCGNGTAGSVARRLFNSVGLNPLILFEEPDGRFPNHHPDPTLPENLVALGKAVRENGALCGLGFDGDTDRIGVVDENGEMLLGDELLALWSRSVLMENPGATIIGDVKCSDRLFQDIAAHGGHPIMWKTGHSLIKEKIKAEKAPFGGEMSGHVFFADRNYGYDDALYAGLRLVEILAKSGKTLGQLLHDFPKAYSTPEIRIDTTEEQKHEAVERLKKAFASQADKSVHVDFTDGIRVSYADGWALARASNTQPVLVVRYESVSQEGLHRIRSQFESIIQL